MINYINYSINELLVTQGNEVLNLENIYKGFNYNKINHKEIITFLTNYKGNYTGFYNRLFLLVTINQILLNINNE